MGDINQNITANFKYYRKLKGWTQGDFADKMKIKRSTFALKESKGDFSPEELTQAAKFFGIPKNELEADHGHSTNTVKIDNVVARLLESNIEILAGQRTILSVLSEMNSPGLKTSSKALSDIYRRMVRDEAEQVAEEMRKK